MFIDLIKANKNLFINELDLCKKNGLKTYIYGAGIGAENIIKRFGTKFNFAGMVVDKRYFTPKKDTYILEEVVAYEKINLVIGHRDFKKENLKPFANNIEKIIDLDCWHGNYEADPTLFDRKFIIENAEKLTWIYNELQDKDSKDALVGYINQKISMDYKYLKSVYRKEGQYFDSGIIKLYDNESFVDCGAYIGDTAEEFVKRINRQFIKPCVAWELIFWKTLTEYFQDPLKKLMDFRLVYHALQTYRLNCYALNLMREV